MQVSDTKNILVVRTDRIGDVVLTLPVAEILRSAYPDAIITFLARSYTHDILVGQKGIDRIILYDEQGTAKPLGNLIAELRGGEFDFAVVCYPRFRIALALLLAGVRIRIGTGFRWYSFLFNRRVYEHRKTAQKHEFEFNVSLLKPLGLAVSSAPVPVLAVTDDARRTAQQERRRLGLSDKDSFIVLHPGSGGSARDWSPANFRILALELTGIGFKIVVTGAQGEEKLVESVVHGTKSSVKASVGKLGLLEYAAFVKLSDLFISNSTGPLHIAAAVGTPVIGFYPPILACSPSRWGPVTKRKIVFVPDRTQCTLCRGGECRGNVCMDQIQVANVISAVRTLIPKRADKRERQAHQ